MKRCVVFSALAAGVLTLFLTACAGGADAAPDEDSLRLEASATAEAPPPEDGEEEESPPEEEPLTLERIRGFSFRDVAPDAAYVDCVGYAACQGLLSGVAEDRFDPDAPVSRAVALTALQRLSGEESPAYNGFFEDVTAERWYAGAAAWAVQAGLIDSGGNLGPLEPITRVQLALLLYRFNGGEEGETLPADPEGGEILVSDPEGGETLISPAGGGEVLSAYADSAAVPDYARAAVSWALENRLFAGTVSDAIYPNLLVSRAQLAQILVAYTAYRQDEPLAQALTTQLSASIAVSASRENHQDIQLLIDAAASRYGAIGLQVAVVENGRLTDAYAYGWATRDSVPMTPDHKLRVASLSKVAVGLTAMLLREEGIIGLDDDIGPYWGIRARNPHYPDTPITIRSLLSHTSSIRAFDDASHSYGAVRSQLSQSSGYSHLRPGAITSWNYNNYAFGVLGMTLETASGRYLDNILYQRLWNAMDIDAAFEGGCIDATDLLVTPYYHGGGVSRSVAAQRELERPEAPGATGKFFAGGLTISSRDMAKMTALLAGDGCFEGVRLVESESVALMEERDPNQLGDGTYQALPLRSQDAIYGRDRLYYHTGSAYGVFNLMSYDPETGDGVVVLTVGASGAKDGRGIYAVCGEISAYIYEVLEAEE